MDISPNYRTFWDTGQGPREKMGENLSEMRSNRTGGSIGEEIPFVGKRSRRETCDDWRWKSKYQKSYRKS